MDLVTGATGFIGNRLVAELRARGRPVRLMARHSVDGVPVTIADLSDPDALARACSGIERVFHCAGHAHAFGSRSVEDAARQRRDNFEGARNLATVAAASGVRSFVFLSSVKAMADPGEKCIDEDWPGAPDSAYGQAKRDAESAVLAAAQTSGMRTTNLRLAMVYGAGGRGNLERMARLIRRGWFPPLPETGNRRSLIHVSDVVEAMIAVADDQRAAGQTFILAGRETPSGRGLYDALRAAAELPHCHWSVPLWAFRGAAVIGDLISSLAGRRFPLDSEALDRLLGSACYSPERIRRMLGWEARVPLATGLSEMLNGKIGTDSGTIRPSD